MEQKQINELKLQALTDQVLQSVDSFITDRNK